MKLPVKRAMDCHAKVRVKSDYNGAGIAKRHNAARMGTSWWPTKTLESSEERFARP